MLLEANTHHLQAEMLKALGHPMRIAIIQLLRDQGEKSVGEIQEHLMVEQAIASHQLGLMKNKGRRSGFRILTVIGGFDTATRMGYLLFLPFLVQGRGGGLPTVGLALALLFIGGAFGKAVFGGLGERLGVVRTVMVAEAMTASLIVATLFTPLPLTLILLPLLGIVLNGTSSVLYGTVPELSDGDTGRAFAIFYTSVIGSGGLAPILYGAIADHSNRTIGVFAAAATAVLIIPLVLALAPHLRSPAAEITTVA